MGWLQLSVASPRGGEKQGWWKTEGGGLRAVDGWGVAAPPAAPGPAGGRHGHRVARGGDLEDAGKGGTQVRRLQELNIWDRGRRRRGSREAGWTQLCSASTAARSRNGRRAAAVQGRTGPRTSVAVATVSMTTRDARAPEDLAVAMVPRGLRSLFCDGAFLPPPPVFPRFFLNNKYC